MVLSYTWHWAADCCTRQCKYCDDVCVHFFSLWGHWRTLCQWEMSSAKRKMWWS